MFCPNVNNKYKKKIIDNFIIIIFNEILDLIKNYKFFEVLSMSFFVITS